MQARYRVLAAALVAVALALGATGCAQKASHLDVKKLQAIIDVRTEDKFVYGHLENAVGADYQMDTFKSRVANLNRDGHYGVYGKNRDEVGAAIRILIRDGFKHLNNLGSIDDAQLATKLNVVM